MYKLSILIPARNEEWLARTVKDICENKNDFTEVIVGIDGEHIGEEVTPHKDVTVVRVATSIGQRAMTNKLCRMSTAKYVMKTDAHTAWDKDFDQKLIADMQDNWTVVPVMRNLHVFDYVCPQGHRRYQSPSGACTICGEPTAKDVVWIPKINPQSTSYRFDHTLHFQYFNEYKKSNRYRRQLKTGLTETMSLQGSCFMMTRDKYWELNICDETFGSWGAQAVEVACKTWLSGGKCVVNHKTWYGHLFRTAGADFGFPYKQDNKQVAHARELSRKLFLDNTWEKQKLPLSWLVDRFAPVPGWHDGTDEGMLEKIRRQPLMVE